MTRSPEQIKDIISFLTPYGAGGLILFLLLYFKEVVVGFFNMIFSWFRK